MNNPDALVESRRVIEDLSAVGVRSSRTSTASRLTFLNLIRSSVHGKVRQTGLPAPGTYQDFATTRPSRSEYEIWWTLGWPYGTSATMARMVFSRIFDKFPGLKVLTHPPA